MSEALSSGGLGSWRASPEEKRYQKQNDEKTKENLRDPGGRARNSPEAQNRRDERNDQEGKCPTKHRFFFSLLVNRTGLPSRACFAEDHHFPEAPLRPKP